MKFTLIICTYQRPSAIVNLLESVQKQTLYPDEILVVDGSLNNETKKRIYQKEFPRTRYFHVGNSDRGLTKQRNFGIRRSRWDIDIVCFLDDDTVLKADFFSKLLNSYKEFPKAIGVGGYIIGEVEWRTINRLPDYNEYSIDGWVRQLGYRNVLRKKLGLLSNKPPGVMPDFSHGFSTGFLPPSNVIYPVEYFMGGVASYKKELFDKISFSEHFNGYGLYEDMDFCLRASRLGQLYVNTGARVYHFHEKKGRPNKIKYGKMVVRNGWYVWRLKYPRPLIRAKLKWWLTELLLLSVRVGNIAKKHQSAEALGESWGRFIGLTTLLFDRPKTQS